MCWLICDSVTLNLTTLKSNFSRQIAPIQALHAWAYACASTARMGSCLRKYCTHDLIPVHIHMLMHILMHLRS